MAEYKEYITQNHENGNVLISHEVVAAIAEHALADVEGVAGISANPVSDIADLIGRKSWGKGMKIMIADDNTVAIDCDVDVCYGCSVVDTAQAVQTALTTAVESMTGVKVTSVNVNVCGIVRV